MHPHTLSEALGLKLDLFGTLAESESSHKRFGSFHLAQRTGPKQISPEAAITELAHWLLKNGRIIRLSAHFSKELNLYTVSMCNPRGFLSSSSYMKVKTDP